VISKYQTISPTNGQHLKTYPLLTQEELDKVLNNARSAQKEWQQNSLSSRIECIDKLSTLLQKNQETYAQLITSEMGKTITESRAEIKKCAFLCDYYTQNVTEFLTPQKINTFDLKAERILQPLGIIYSIMPWNFPFWQVLRASIPSLLLGNGIVLKHARNVLGSAQALSELIQECTSSNIFQNIIINEELSEYTIKHDIIAAITLTGSNRAGSIVAKQAGEVCKKVILELGGSDAYIIRHDVDIDEVAKQIVTVRTRNAGQECISPKRIIVDQTIKKEFEQKVVHYMNSIKIGNPSNEQTMMGPIARSDLRDTLHQQVQKTIEEGAQLLCGGKFLQIDHGYYYVPTVLTNVTSNMTAFQEELFGPVLSIIGSKNDEHAIELANSSQYGLGSGIFTKNIGLAKEIAAHKIEAGMCFINQCVASHPALPFGGIKQSGYGRECAQESLQELANIKTVLVA